MHYTVDYQYDCALTFEENLENFAKLLVAEQSFAPCTYSDLICYAKFGDSDFEYNRATLRIIPSNMDEEFTSKLLGFIKNHLKNKFKRQMYQTYDEYRSLCSYLELCPELQHLKIIKGESPDFVLENGYDKIGIEITQFTLQIEEATQKTLNQYKGEAYTTATLKDFAQRKFRTSMSKMFFPTILGKATVGGTWTSDDATKPFADLIKKKIDKLLKQQECYHDYIILCDARHSVCITVESDLERIIEELQPDKTWTKPFRVVILYEDSVLNTTAFYEKRFPPN